MSGSFESVRWRACVHRLNLGLNSHLKDFGGMEPETMSAPREKSPLSEAQRRFEPMTHRTVSPIQYRLSYSGPPTIF